MLLEAGAFLSRSSGAEELLPLHRAACHYSADMTQKLVEHGAFIDQPHPVNGMTALHYAIVHNKFQNAEYLLKQGANPGALTADGQTPLLLAVTADNAPIVSLLLKAKADVNYQRAAGTGETALHRAAGRGSSEIVSTLLQGGADPLLADIFNRTAGRQAAAEGYSYLASRLEDAEAEAERAFFEKARKTHAPRR
jgi:ankyrin repeat protein